MGILVSVEQLDPSWSSDSLEFNFSHVFFSGILFPFNQGAV